MKPVLRLLTYTFVFLLIAGCSSKKYYEPKETSGSVDYRGSLPASIVAVTRDGATLDNGNIITIDGLQEGITIPEEYILLSASETHFTAANSCGGLILINKADKSKTELDFKSRVVSAKAQDDLLALVTQENTLMLYSLSSNETLYQEKGEATHAHDVRLASPYFLNDLILFPSLDGKVVVVDKNTYKHIRIIVVNTSEFWNNVIFLDVLQNRLVAATQEKIISVSPEIIRNYVADIREVIFVRDAIYTFTKDGRIVLLDIDLNVRKELKFPFAHFTGAIHGKYIYGVEKEGYLIATDPDLASSVVFEIPSSIDSKIFAAQNKIFYDDNYIELNTK